MQYVAGRYDPLLVADDETHCARNDNCHLLVRMTVGRCFDEWSEPEAAHHKIFADDHLPCDPFGRFFDLDPAPIRHQRVFLISSPIIKVMLRYAVPRKPRLFN